MPSTKSLEQTTFDIEEFVAECKALVEEAEQEANELRWGGFNCLEGTPAPRKWYQRK